jgi:hypothetical protein
MYVDAGIEKGTVSSGFQKLLIPIAASLKKSFLGAQKWTITDHCWALESALPACS